MKFNKLGLALFVLMPFCVNAEAELEKTQVSIANKLLGNDLASSNASMVNKVELTAGESKKTVDIVLKPFKDTSNFSLTLSAPLNDTGDPKDLYESKTDVFANSTTIKLNYRKYSPPTFSLKPSERRQAINLCLNKPSLYGFTATKETAEGQKVEKKKFCETNIDSLVAKFDDSKASDAEKALMAPIQREFFAPFSFYGVTATYGREEYEYFKPDSIETTDETENPWGVSVYYSYVIPNLLWATAEFSYQEGYETQDSQTRCPLANDDNLTYLSCVSSAIGVPEESKNKNLTLSVRFPVYNLAMSPKITYDFEDDEHTFTLPVYFLGNGDGDLTAGIRFDYESGGEGSKFSLFVGSKFEVF
ncbi:MAG: hypothetical protein ACSHW0_17070 [Thalassotalea sp.]